MRRCRWWHGRALHSGGQRTAVPGGRRHQTFVLPWSRSPAPCFSLSMGFPFLYRCPFPLTPPTKPILPYPPTLPLPPHTPQARQGHPGRRRQGDTCRVRPPERAGAGRHAGEQDGSGGGGQGVSRSSCSCSCGGGGGGGREEQGEGNRREPQWIVIRVGGDGGGAVTSMRKWAVITVW